MNARVTVLILSLLLALPAVGLPSSEATAFPFDTLTESRKKGKRTHKKARSDDDDDDRRKTTRRRKKTRKKTTTRRTSPRRTTNRRPRSSTKRRTTTTRRRTTRPSSSRNRSRTTRHRTRVKKNQRTRRTTTRTRTRRTTHRHRRTRHTHRHRRTRHTHRHDSSARVEVHHTGSSNRRTSEPKPAGYRGAVSEKKNTVDAYVTGGLGISGLAASEITDVALPGAGYEVAVGAQKDWFGAELGLNGGGYTFTPGASPTDITMLGVSADLMLQPSFAFLEPYVFAGLGIYAMSDQVIEETATGGALRLGGGIDFRFDNAAIGVRYLHSSYRFADTDGGYGGDLAANSETLGLALKFYF